MPKTTKVMFFDDTYLLVKRNLSRHVGQPTLVPEGTFQDPNADVSFGYPSVLPNPDGEGGDACTRVSRSIKPLTEAAFRGARCRQRGRDNVANAGPDQARAARGSTVSESGRACPVGPLRRMGSLLLRRICRGPRRADQGVCLQGRRLRAQGLVAGDVTRRTDVA